MKNYLVLVSLISCLSVTAQQKKFHTPVEMLKIAIDSKLTYNVQIAEDPIPPRDFSDNLVYPEYRSVRKGEQIELIEYKPNVLSKMYFDKAEAAYKDNKIMEARENYLSAYREDSTMTIALTYLGQISEHQKDFGEAEKYFKESIGRNDADYMAHWFLANVYEHNGAIQKALDEITIAHILNRNNPRIMTAMKEIFQKSGYQYNDSWQFDPQYRLSSTDSGINVTYHGIWLGYALAQALWNYEPGYKESMGVTDKDLAFNQDREKEGLVAVMVAVENEKKNVPESIVALRLAADKELFQAYLFYEIWLRKKPGIGMQLPPKFRTEIKDYILAVRCKK
jgi:tetratricopeptide (TPR) repeat protein